MTRVVKLIKSNQISVYRMFSYLLCQVKVFSTIYAMTLHMRILFWICFG